jgi:hypothetical protein
MKVIKNVMKVGKNVMNVWKRVLNNPMCTDTDIWFCIQQSIQRNKENVISKETTDSGSIFSRILTTLVIG